MVRSTATLACVGRRRNYFREEFLSALEILQRGDVPPEHLIGSWAGAFGPTQFMPTSFKRYAVDFDGDGHRDVVDSIPDLVASTANNLKTDGWVSGRSWGYEVTLPQNFDYLLADRAKQMTIKQWEGLGVRRAGNKPFPHADETAFLLLPAGARGPAFLMTQNFRVIMKYNPAEAYALAIGYLADRMRGGAPFIHDWPRDERVLTLDERLELQQLSGDPWVRHRQPGRTAWPANADRHPQLSGFGRSHAGRICLLERARPVAPAVTTLPRGHPQTDIFWLVCAPSGAAAGTDRSRLRRAMDWISH